MNENKRQNRFVAWVLLIVGSGCIAVGLVGCGVAWYQGPPGPQGPTGPQGYPGPNGHSALFSQVSADSTACANGGTVIGMGIDGNDDTVLAPSEIVQVAIICNGLNGNSPNLPAFTPVAAIMPCGPTSSPFKEVLLGLLGGAILSEFSGNGNANTVRNTLIPDGNYYNTDNSQCNFSVLTDGSGNRVVSWDGSSHNSSGPYQPGHADYNASSLTWTVVY